MAKVTGQNAVIHWIWSGGTVVLSTDYRSINTSETIDTVDTTAGSDTHKTIIATIKSASIDYSGLYLAGSVGPLLNGALNAGIGGMLRYYPEGTVTGMLIRSYPAISMGPKISSPYNDVIEISCTFQSNGAWS